MKPNKKKRRIIWVSATIAAVVVALLLGGFAVRQRARADAVPESGETVTAFLGTLSSEASASGQLLPKREASLSVETTGRVDQVLVEVGDQVQTGDVLVQLESDALERAVRSAEQTLAIQEANLAELRKDPSEEDIAAARAAVESAKAQLDELLTGASNEDLKAAEAAVDSARAQLDDLLEGAGAAQLAQARAALVSAEALAGVETDRYEALDAQRTVARQQLDMATVALENAKYFYNALANDWQHKDYADYSPEAETLKDAQTSYDVALARYNLTAANLNDSALKGALAQVAQARANLAALTEERTVDIAAAREQLASAVAALAALTDEKAPQIAGARSQLAQAEANLQNLLEGASDERLEIAEAQVAQARVSFANAQARLADATLVAPFDGVVTAVYVSVGEWASGPAVELVDANSLEVILDVDEVDIGLVSVGQPATITLEPWPDEEIQGEVVAIAPMGDSQTEIVTYEVHISLEAGELPIRTGMTANANLTTAQRDNVLLVANRAITSERGTARYYVHRVEGDSVTQTEVTIGLRDGSHTEITSGLEPGDKLVLDYEREGLPFGPGQGAQGRTRFGD